MIKFEEIIQEKNKGKRDLLIKIKLSEYNSTSDSLTIDTSTIMTGFISNQSTVIFSNWHYDLNMGLGNLYGMKSDDYFYEFFDFLVEHNLTSKQDAVNQLSSFLKKYFDESGVKKNDREKLFDDICYQLDQMSSDKESFEKCKDSWLDIGIFKDRSAAECTEHTAISQNLLCFCDIDSCYVSGHMRSPNSDEDHAFNIFQMNGEYYLLDTTNPICLYDSNDNYVGCKSYVYQIPYEKIREFISEKGIIKLPKCNYMNTSDGKTVMVDKSYNEYTTTSKPLNREQFNIFFNFIDKTL